jgi:hypothetical protein
MLYVDGFAIAGPTAGNPFTIEYEPNEPINGILVLVADTNTDAVDPAMTGVTVDGIPLDIVDQSPFYHTNGDDDAQLLAFFLGSGIPADVFPTGELSYVFEMDDAVAGAASVRVFHIVSSLGSDTGIAGTGTDSSAGVTNPTYEMGPTTFPTLPFGLLVSGHDANSSVTSGVDWDDTEQDMGTRVASWVQPATGEELPASDPDTITMDWVAAVEDAGWFGVLVYELEAEPGIMDDSWKTVNTEALG